MKRVGMIIGNVELNPQRTPIWAWSKLQVLKADIKDITQWRDYMNFMFEWQEHYLTSEHGEQVRYCSCQETYWWQHFWLFSEDFWSLSKDFPKLFRGPDKRSQTFSENFQRFPKIRVEICAWHGFLLTLETTLIKLQRCFDQTTSAFSHPFFYKANWVTAF